MEIMEIGTHVVHFSGLNWHGIAMIITWKATSMHYLLLIAVAKKKHSQEFYVF